MLYGERRSPNTVGISRLREAEHDPQWAEKNPATVTVKRDQNDQLYLETWPCL